MSIRRSRGRSRPRATWLVVALAALLVAAACGADGDDPDAADDLPTIRVPDSDWESLWVNNEIFRVVAEHGYGRDVEVMPATIAVAHQATVDDELDVLVEIWPTNIQDWWDEQVEAGTLHDMNVLMAETGRGFYVPRYVVEGDPERGIEPMAPTLSSFEDLPRYADVFADPEDRDRGQIVNCITGWDCAASVDVKVQVYGLDEHFNLLEPGSAAAMDAAIVGPYRAGEPVVFYYWEPTWIVADLDLIRLDMEPEPPSEECLTATLEMMEGERPISDDARCGFQNPSVHIAVGDGFYQRESEHHPELLEFISNMYVGTETMSDLSLWLQDQDDADPEDAAAHFFATHPDIWREWVPDDVAERIVEGLEAEGVELSG